MFINNFDEYLDAHHGGTMVVHDYVTWRRSLAIPLTAAHHGILAENVSAGLFWFGPHDGVGFSIESAESSPA